MTTVDTERRISHYRIEGELGAGGMGVIYRAVDERLGRRVAIKCLRGALSASASARQRFFDEARAAASLDHPNICTIFDVDECDGEIFIAMALYDGETLDVALRRGAMPLQRSLDLAIQAGRGLAAAHEELLVHRDIKPANIMITTHESVKILDFGLALLRGSGTIDGNARIDGTPLYMSPEQLRGEPADHRSDIWSLGVVLFEMLTGSAPFRGESLPAIAEAVLHGSTPVASACGIDLPPALDRMLARALAKDLRSRYARIDLFVDDLLNLRAEVDSAALTVRREAASKKASIAVLPFTDMSPERNQEYLCDGIAEEVLGALSSVAELRVVSRTSAFQFKGQSTDIRDIGAKLNVDTVVEGSVRRSGNRVRISAQLVNVEDGYRLWYERFDREMKDIFAIQDEIAQRVAEALQVSIVERSRHPGAVVSSNDAEAYALYLQGRQFFHQHRRKAFEIAIQNFRRVIDMNPAYARAWAGLADCNSFLRLFLGGGPETVVASEEASAKALELAPELAEAHTSRGFSLFLTERYDEAEVELRKAVELDPQLYDAHYLFGRISFARGRYADAAAHFRRGCLISPEAYDSWYLLGMCYRKLNEPVKGRSADRECIEAVKVRVRQHPDDTRAWTMGAAVLAEAGEPERAAEWVQRAVAIDADEPIIVYNAACVYTALGRHEDAIDCLENVIARSGISESWMMNDPDLDPLRGYERFRALFKTDGAR